MGVGVGWGRVRRGGAGWGEGGLGVGLCRGCE